MDTTQYLAMLDRLSWLNDEVVKSRIGKEASKLQSWSKYASDWVCATIRSVSDVP